MSEETKSLLMLLALIFGSASLTVGCVLLLAAYCLKGKE